MKNDDEEFTGEEHEDDIYDEDERDELEEEDEISPEEEGFMKGYDEGKKMSACPKCGKVLVSDFVEKEIDGETYRFCSDSCANAFKGKIRG